MFNFFEYFPSQISKILAIPNVSDVNINTNSYKIAKSYQEVFDEFYKIFDEFYKMDLKTSYMSYFLNNNQFLYKNYGITYNKLFLDVYIINRFLINKKLNTIDFIREFLTDLGLGINIKEGNNEVILYLRESVDFEFDSDFDFEFNTESSVIPSEFFSFDNDFDFEFTGEPIDIDRPVSLATQLSFPLFPQETSNTILKLDFILSVLRKILPATTYIRIL